MLARVELKSLQHNARAAKHAAARSVYAQDIDPVTELAEWFVSGQPRKEVRARVTQLMSSGAEGASCTSCALCASCVAGVMPMLVVVQCSAVQCSAAQLFVGSCAAFQLLMGNK